MIGVIDVDALLLLLLLLHNSHFRMKSVRAAFAFALSEKWKFFLATNYSTAGISVSSPQKLVMDISTLCSVLIGVASCPTVFSKLDKPIHYNRSHIPFHDGASCFHQ